MNWKDEWKPLLILVAVFLACFWLPIGRMRFDTAILEALHLVKWYAREHVVLCLLPAFLIAGAIAVFVSQGTVMRYLGARANKILAYGVASVSGTILAVCSCTVLPLFAGIYRRGAGLGPAAAFLYSGPAINVLAIILTARILGPGLGVARAVGALVFSVVIGLLMHGIFRKEELQKADAATALPDPGEGKPLGQRAIYFAVLVGILVFANWGRPESASGIWMAVYSLKWWITGVFAAGLGVVLIAWFGVRPRWVLLAALPTVVLALFRPEHPTLAFGAGIIGLVAIAGITKGEVGDWLTSSWEFAKKILPFLLFGVLAAGLLLGRPGGEGLIPPEWVSRAVGGNSLSANLFASVAGAFMYFATLTEVPILQGLMGSGMGKGPALALLLAGPALSLPNMLVIRTIMGTKKTAVFVLLVIVMATASGVLYGKLF